jgi:two-component system LytT family response regulator
MIREMQPDLVFLDVRMPLMDGFELVEALEEEEGPQIIFVTAYDKFAIKAFDAHAVDYLLKPVEDDRLARAIDRARQRIDEQTRSDQAENLWGLIRELRDSGETEIGEKLGELLDKGTTYQEEIWIKDRGRAIRVDISKIEWIRAVRDYVCIYVPDQSFLVRETMKALEDKLDPSKFMRVHRSAIVNQTKVKELRYTANGGHLLIMESGEEVRVGRTYSTAISQRFGRRN